MRYLLISLLSAQNSSTVIVFACRITRFMMRDLLDQQQLGTGQAHFSMLRDLKERLEVTDITILQVNTITHGLHTITDQARFVSTNDMIDNHYGSRHGGLNIEPEEGIFWILNCSFSLTVSVYCAAIVWCSPWMSFPFISKICTVDFYFPQKPNIKELVSHNSEHTCV